MSSSQVQSQLIIAFSADFGYAEYLQVLIKSILYHNKNIKFYLLNKDYPDEWFDYLNQKLVWFNSEILDAKVNYIGFEHFKTLPHITESTFYRYILSDLPENKVLYLDSDMIVENSLMPLFNQELNDFPIAACSDFVLNNPKIEHFYLESPNLQPSLKPYLKPYFNAGMILADLKKWRELNIRQNLFDLSQQYEVEYGDQDILNIYFQNKWLELDSQWNYQTGAIGNLALKNLWEDANSILSLAPSTKIIHYTTSEKPWRINEFNHNKNSSNLFRERYWFYRQLNWTSILQKHQKHLS